MSAEFSCKFKEGVEISPKILKNLNIEFNQIYANSENILKISKAIKNKNDANFVTLPFCHTIEAKAMGADIIPADEIAGPRPGSYVYNSLEEIIEISITDSLEIQLLLNACKELKSQGETVAFMVTGPISILSNLMDLTVLFKTWRKSPEKIQRAFSIIEAVLLEYIEGISKSGADIISFADPAGNPDILGDKYNTFLIEIFLLRFLKQAIKVCSPGTLLCICPLAASNLSKQGLILKNEGNSGNIACSCIKNNILPLNIFTI